MIEKQMIKLLLGKKFYTKYKGQISRNVFQGSFGSLFETIQKAHEKYDADISVDELYSLHTAIYNPALKLLPDVLLPSQLIGPIL